MNQYITRDEIATMFGVDRASKATMNGFNADLSTLCGSGPPNPGPRPSRLFRQQWVESLTMNKLLIALMCACAGCTISHAKRTNRVVEEQERQLPPLPPMRTDSVLEAGLVPHAERVITVGCSNAPFISSCIYETQLEGTTNMAQWYVVGRTAMVGSVQFTLPATKPREFYRVRNVPAINQPMP